MRHCVILTADSTLVFNGFKLIGGKLGIDWQNVHTSNDMQCMLVAHDNVKECVNDIRKLHPFDVRVILVEPWSM